MSLPLSQLASILSGQVISDSDLDQLVSGICSDSRKVRPDDLFVAISGQLVDGHKYIDQAFKSGAKACIVENAALLNGRPGIIVKDSRAAWSRLAALWHDFPARDILVIGVTGTSGKTSILTLIGQALSRLGRPSVRFGTLGVYIADKLISDSLTTPDAWEMQNYLCQALKQGVNSAVLEVSSHGLEQQRVQDLEFNVAIFTNLSRDHLDYHKDMDSYFLAKRRLFDLLSQSGKAAKLAVINTDDPYGKELNFYAKSLGLRTLSYGSENCDLKFTDLKLSFNLNKFTVEYENETAEVISPLIGRHNAYNLLAVLGTLLGLGFSKEKSLALLSELQPAKGRLESVGNADIGVYVDYSHKPDALESALKALRPVCENKLWVVFGCGGDRDRGKRPEMGKIAAALADNVVVTSDNPRTEDPAAIISEILTGFEGAPIHVNADRKAAIEYALANASKGDVVLIAGKGHEDYQIIGTQKIHFADQEIVSEFFRKQGGLIIE